MVKLFKRNPLDLTGFQHVVDGVLQYANGLYQSHAFHLAGCGIHVASTAHTLHDDLYIDLINGSGADIDLALIIGKYKTCLNALDIQQFVGCLRTNDGRAGQILCGTQRDCKELLVDLCLTDSIR